MSNIVFGKIEDTFSFQVSGKSVSLEKNAIVHILAVVRNGEGKLIRYIVFHDATLEAVSLTPDYIIPLSSHKHLQEFITE